ncbi:GNAT family N-acetyltransferase [Flagellimonas olearia]|uniref:GNAT family N-acetyltransferase n=1 Tax=Flagellimonas olearia TaxID=552546 RepID=A0A6I1E3S7_9FLAO|nr:GNAT family N-acetyltransferase [Allomuricauda olearia]KAB7530501.1 GNAT family N-acetyltransferase [Allomuricauda olearia]
MMIENNPFTSDIYAEEWMKSFFHGKQAHNFRSIKGVSFTKNKFLPLYTNVGKYKTCGISYSLDQTGLEDDFKGKVFLIYDIPDFVHIDTTNIPNKMGVLKSKQYYGYLIDLNNYDSINSYLADKLSGRRKKKLVASKKKMEGELLVEYKVYESNIPVEKYEYLFESLFLLIDKRFTNKNTTNAHSPIEIKNWYKSLFFRLIQNNQASITSVEVSGTPIAVSFNYNSSEFLFSAIPILDDDFLKYGIGNIRLIKNIEYSINKKFKFYDLGKGSYGYKHRWATKKYSFEHHILYDKRSPKSILIATILIFYFRLKQFARKVYRKVLKKDN